MPELCRFYNIVIKMIYNDNINHIFMSTIQSMKPLSESTVNFLREVYR